MVRKKDLILVIVFLFFVFYVPSIYATNYYVKPSATGNNNGSDLTNAWTSFSSINWNLISAGDIIYLVGGENYTGTLSVLKSGTSTKPINISVYGSGAAIIDLQNINMGISLSGNSYINIDGVRGNALENDFNYGLKFINVGGNTGCVYDGSGSSNIKVSHIDCSGSTVYGGDDYGGIRLGGGGNTQEVSYNWIHGPSEAKINTSLNWWISGIVVWSSELSNSSYNNTKIHHNKVEYLYHDGIKSNNQVSIYDNEVSYIHNSGHSDSILCQSGNYCAIYNNYIHDSNDQNIYLDNLYNYAKGKVVIYNNIIDSPSGFGIIIDGEGGVGSGNGSAWEDVSIIGNTFYRTGAWSISATRGKVANLTIQNNIFGNVLKSGGYWQLYLRNSVLFNATTKLDYNLYLTNSTSSPYIIQSDGVSYNIQQLRALATAREVNGNYANPLLVDALNGDYHLSASDSAARDKGISLSGIYSVDKNGNTRPQGAAWDIGAYEYTLPTTCTNCHYVRAGASGSNNGSDWTNAYRDIPSVLIRNHTYYIAAGNYNSHLFNTPEIGTQLINIKKANSTSHGGDTGWISSYENGQAIFNSTCSSDWYGCNSLRFSTGYWDFDGVSGSGENKSSYGFAVKTDYNNYPDHYVSIDASQTANLVNIAIRHIAITCSGNIFDQEQQGFFAGSQTNSNNTIIQNLYVDNCTVGLLTRGNNWLIENSYFGNDWSSPSHHGVPINVFDTYNATFRYNTIKKCTYICIESNLGTKALNGWNIYSNIFDPHFDVYQGIISGASNSVVVNTNIFQNTIINSAASLLWQQNMGATPDKAYGNSVKNNLFYNSTGSLPSNNGLVINSSNNSYFSSYGYNLSESGIQIAAGSPFVDINLGDYHLAYSTSPGEGISSISSLDKEGKTRGADGLWDRGAYEYYSTNLTITNYHIADINTDNNISSLELNNYISGYLSGSYNLINALYLITLKQKGGKYNYNSSSNCDAFPWSCYITL